jgi:hypothetical protein
MTPNTCAVGDKVTIHTGTTVYDITQVADDMAKVWPVDDRDNRDGFWIGADQLRPFRFEMTELTKAGEQWLADHDNTKEAQT